MKSGLVSIGLASAVIATALLVLVYHGGPAGPEPAWVGWLPFVNAAFNSLSAAAIVCGVLAIRRGRREVHRRWMLTALASSAVFLVSYVTYHALHGDSRFLGQGAVRPIYFFVLISHILLSVAALPLVLSTFYLALSGRFDLHRRVARWTYPIWLYVSVTGVVVFAMLQIFGSARTL
jgi:putative membrane protein